MHIVQLMPSIVSGITLRGSSAGVSLSLRRGDQITGTLANFGLPLLLVLHDVWTKRRLHPATLFGVSAYLVTLLGAVFFSFSAAGLALIRALQ